jgi:hypothetical protein
MPKPKPLGKEMILAAMAKTKSNRAGARYLNVCYTHYKKWAKFYKDETTGKTLFDLHLNRQGKGISKFLNHGKKDVALLDIIEGRVDPSSFNPDKIKYKLLQEGHLKEECYMCGFHERRVLDYKMPLLLHFKNGNKMHYVLSNLEMLCYNCYYLLVGNIFTDKQIEGIEDHKFVNNSEVNWEVDDYTQQRLVELGLYDPKPLDDGSEFISRI